MQELYPAHSSEEPEYVQCPLLLRDDGGGYDEAYLLKHQKY